jgi:hypothetical protein
MIKYSNMLKEVINLYPKEVVCDDAKVIGNEGLKWYSLFDAQEEIDEKNNHFENSNELLSALVWSVYVGVASGFRKQYAQENKPCTTVKILDIIDLDTTKEHFMESVEDEEWQNYLKEINEEILFDDINKSDLI